jgi:hypothetical protein
MGVPKIEANILGSGGGGGGPVAVQAFTPLVAGTWYTVGLCVRANNSVEVQILSETGTAPITATLPGPATFATVPYYAIADVYDGGAQIQGDIDFVYFGDVRNRLFTPSI